MLARLLGLVKALVIGKGVGVGANDVRVQKRRTSPLPNMLDRFAGRLVGLQEIRTVALERQQVWEVLHQRRDAAARRLDVHGDRDRVAVVLDHKEYRERARTSAVQRFPEFAFARRAVADRNVHRFVRVEARGELSRFLQPREIKAGVRRAHRLQGLGSSRA